MSLAKAILNTLFPSTCAACGEVLVGDERQLCSRCLGQLPYTFYSSCPDNPAEMRLAAKMPFVHATAMLEYRQTNRTRDIVHAMKFSSNSELCLLMGRLMGLDLLRAGRFDDVDLLVPVPLHWRRRLQRGYNQSELLCRGIACNLPRPVESRALVRHRYTRQQSLQQHHERANNVADAFRIRHPERLAGHHILLVDDVLTTGATLTSCCDALATVPDLRISIATLSMAV